jgi:hypothetical protein
MCPNCTGKRVIHANTNSLILFQPCPCVNPMKAKERLERWYKKFMEETEYVRNSCNQQSGKNTLHP